MVNAPLMRCGESKLLHEPVEEMPPGAVLHFHDPDVGIEAELARQIGFRIGFGARLLRQAGAESAIDRMRLVEGGLRCRTINLRGAVEAVELDEDRARLIGAAAADG